MRPVDHEPSNVEPGSTGRPNESYRVLVVDDIEQNREILARRLRRYGYAVSVEENGIKALAHLSNQPVDLMMLDIMMPEMDGYAVLENMKADPALSEIPVIVISAVEEVESIARCITLGAEDYLPKPFDPVVLKARVSATLERKSLRDQRKRNLADLKQEKEKVDEILNAILPGRIADELKLTGKVTPRRIENVSVLFSDIVGFTRYCDRKDPDLVFDRLEELVAGFEQVVGDHGVEKIKTLGDGFMAASGLSEDSTDPVLACARAAKEWILAASTIVPGWEVRVGIHLGPVVAGIVGARRFAYDLWGDTVNTAARVESLGRPGAICFSQSAHESLPESYGVDGSYESEAKGKGRIKIYYETILDSPTESALR